MDVSSTGPAAALWLQWRTRVGGLESVLAAQEETTRPCTCADDRRKADTEAAGARSALKDAMAALPAPLARASADDVTGASGGDMRGFADSAGAYDVSTRSGDGGPSPPKSRPSLPPVADPRVWDALIALQTRPG